MAQQKRRPANDRASKKYQLNNQLQKNKIKKLERHVKKFPNDKLGMKNLERIKKDGYKPNKKPPIVSGKNSHFNQHVITFTFEEARPPLTDFVKMLSEAFHRPVPIKRRPKKYKPKITHKKSKI